MSSERRCVRSRQELFELRTAASFAWVCGEHGKPGKARELLARFYGWFTEAFDTRDLKEAQALLDEVAA